MDGASRWRDKEGLDSISIWGDTLVHANLIINAPNPPFMQHPLTNLPAVATHGEDQPQRPLPCLLPCLLE